MTRVAEANGLAEKTMACDERLERVILVEPKVIFHIDEMQKWSLLLNNVTNLVMSYEGAFPDAKIEVLANSEAVRGYLRDGNSENLSAMGVLSQKGVWFAACNHTLQGLKITGDRLFQFVRVVPAGVRELADRQMEGYAYIKP